MTVLLMPPGVYGDRGLESFTVPMHHTVEAGAGAVI